MNFERSQGASWKIWVIASTFVAVLALIWMRTGVFPAASTGDDSWAAEPAYHLYQEGVPKRSWTADEHGSASKDFFPPPEIVIDASLFAIFGVNAFSETAQSSLICCLLAILVVLLAHRSGASRAMSLLTGIAVFGPEIVLQDAIHVRPDGDMAAFLLLSLLLQSLAISGSWWRRMIFAFLAGFSLGVACLSYYPMAPFALAAGFLGLPWRTRPQLKQLATFLAGGATSLSLMLLYIGSQWLFFIGQMSTTGASYFSWTRLLAPILNVIKPIDGSMRLMSVETAVVLCLSIVIAIYGVSEPSRLYARRAIIMALPYFIFGTPTTMIVAGVLFIIALSASAASSTEKQIGFLKLSTAARVALVAVALLGCVKVCLISVSAYLQRSARNYAEVSRQLNALVRPPGKAAIEQSAWLALRPHFDDGSLHLLINSESPQEYVFRSLILRGPDAGDRFTYVVIKQGQLSPFLRDYPGFRKAFGEGVFHETGHVTLPCRNLPMAHCPVYDLIVYKRDPLP